ncbi:hypothetical protein [Oryza sativa Japonica Group]|uniref:Uncharacterized protein n=1 Tax=Oryza sativa subsp. japonica TaxID=39947 RepID=Q5ZAL9_ORYSJ|nr:hypothetical protein [Oryza sativa Japonica Group]BAD53375.1 hypothetical protein [Oryza sativa Japonica Group]
MRREGRMHGWVYAHKLVDPMDPDGAGGKAKRRVVHDITKQMANGGFVRVSRKPTNHSKYTGRDPYEAYTKRKTCKGRNKFKHDEIKMYYLDVEGLDDDDEYEEPTQYVSHYLHFYHYVSVGYNARAF